MCPVRQTANQDWGPFGRPLFDDPAARALSRVGVVDIGSNSVRLVVFDGAARSPAYFYNEKIMCALGAGMSETGRLNPEGRVQALAALKRFQALAPTMDLPSLTTVATAAVREASDGRDFVEEVARETGLRVWVIDGQEEARLSAQGVLLGWPGSYGLVCDIGGASMELAEIRDGRVGKRETSQLGPLRLIDVKGGKSGRKAEIKSQMEVLSKKMGPQPDRMFLVGGSWRAIARIDMHRRNYPLPVMHEYRMTTRAVQATARYVAENDLEVLRQQAGVSANRAALVPIALEVLKRLVRTFKPKDIAISSYGIREGLLYEQMPQRLRDRDPLIESCRFAEAKDARQPGAGKVIYNFIMPIFRKAPANEQRLIKAACLLHDVTWRAHPDFRAEVCFDNATRSNLGGLKHSERVFLGLALLHRYSNRREGTRFENLYDLISQQERQRAEVLGKALRFASMLGMAPETRHTRFEWSPKKRVLQLVLGPATRNLFGEVAAARFQSLADALQAEAKITYVKE